MIPTLLFREGAFYGVDCLLIGHLDSITLFVVYCGLSAEFDVVIGYVRVFLVTVIVKGISCLEKHEFVVAYDALIVVISGSNSLVFSGVNVSVK